MKETYGNPSSQPGPSKPRSIKTPVMGLDMGELHPLADRLLLQWETITLVNHPQLNTKGMVKKSIINGKSPMDEVWDKRKQNYSSDQSVI